MDIFLKNKSAVVAITVLLLGFLLYSVLMSPADTAPGQTVADNPGEDLVAVAAELSSITFRQDVFQSAGYRSLVDWSVAIPSEPAGRPNPFETIGRD